ncbi:hypothetical protein BDM02DRAFT_1250223 [Thelephora ganbajun]|uniref:Uncharacterized protein n=1 Tax=Thelephora ganbajun TaxID=370292 RepID=A0ACB6Z356_THEGA|nr:hypothetical protein BDM02DRAFT_1250223 [Thelephora ganbajun]
MCWFIWFICGASRCSDLYYPRHDSRIIYCGLGLRKSRFCCEIFARLGHRYKVQTSMTSTAITNTGVETLKLLRDPRTFLSSLTTHTLVAGYKGCHLVLKEA